MKRGLLLVCVAFLATVACAQNKIIEKSAKSTPAWLMAVPEDFLVVSVSGETMGEVERKAQEEILERIITAVASNVVVKTSSSVDNKVVGDVAKSELKFKKTAKTNSASLPFIKDISLTNAEDIYWVKYQNKSTKEYSYEYTVMYPFSKRQQRELLAEFERIDAEKTAQLKELEAQIDAIGHIDEIKAAVTRLETLETYFFDDVRISEAEGLKARYKQLYGSINITGKFIAPGKYECWLLLKGKPVAASTLPTVTSNCAGRLQVQPADGKFIVSYDAADCLPEEENALLIQFKISGRKISHTAYFNESGGAGILGK